MEVISSKLLLKVKELVQKKRGSKKVVHSKGPLNLNKNKSWKVIEGYVLFRSRNQKDTKSIIEIIYHQFNRPNILWKAKILGLYPRVK